MAEDTRRLFVILNPRSGRASSSSVRERLQQRFPGGGDSCVIHELSEQDDLVALSRNASEQGFDVVVAAGGDGSVSGVANTLVGRPTALGILPLGTANVLAQELGIPLDVAAAVDALAGPNRILRIDAMRFGDRHALTQIAVGIGSLMIRDTPDETKRRFGILAYLGMAIRKLPGFAPRRFDLVVDGKPMSLRATDLVLANSQTMGQKPFRWGPDIRPDDGKLTLCAIRTRTLRDYLGVAWHFLIRQEHRSRNVLYINVTESVSISTRRPLPVQADGEIIGDTPIEVQLVPGALAVVVPRETELVTGRPEPT